MSTEVTRTEAVGSTSAGFWTSIYEALIGQRAQPTMAPTNEQAARATIQAAANPAPRIQVPAASAVQRPAVPLIKSETVPASKWTSNDKWMLERLESVVADSHTPFIQAHMREGSTATTVSGTYGQSRGDVAEQRVVSDIGKDKVMKLRLFLPVSGHTGQFDKYSREDAATVWVTYTDRGNADPASSIPLPTGATPSSSGGAPANVRILAEGIRCPKRASRGAGETEYHLVRVVDVEVPMFKDKIATVSFDGNGTQPLADAPSFQSGRNIVFFWDGSTGR